MKQLVFLGTILAALACQQKQNVVEKNTISVGAMDGPEAELVEAAALEAKSLGLDVKIVRFADYVAPNASLAEGSTDVNAFQHQPYLDETIKAKGYKLVAVGNTFLYPLGLYSKKIKSLSSLPAKSKIAIPNDPSNEGRSLMVLVQAGLIKLRENVGVLATPEDIVENKKDLQIIPLDAAQTVRSLDDVTLAAINTNYAVSSGLKPTQDAIFIETKESPYMNLIVAREDNKNDERVKTFVRAFQSQRVIDRAMILFQNASVAGFLPSKDH